MWDLRVKKNENQLDWWVKRTILTVYKVETTYWKLKLVELIGSKQNNLDIKSKS